jgi:hypothetical protein
VCRGRESAWRGILGLPRSGSQAPRSDLHEEISHPACAETRAAWAASETRRRDSPWLLLSPSPGPADTPQQNIQAFYPPGSLDIIAATVASSGALEKIATEWRMPMELASDLVSLSRVPELSRLAQTPLTSLPGQDRAVRRDSLRRRLGFHGFRGGRRAYRRS